MQRLGANPFSMVSGVVLSIDDAPLDGISVTIGNRTTTTDSQGHYTFTDIPAGNHVVTFEHPLYVLTQRPVTVMPANKPKVDVNLLLRSDAQTLDVDQGGSIVDGPLSVYFEPEDLAFADGTPVHGLVDVVMTVIDPRRPQHVLAAPARLEGVDTNGAQVGLISFGMAEIEAFQGTKKLQVRPGRSVTAAMNVSGLANLAPEGDSIPMWHLDTELGLWVQDQSSSVPPGVSGRTRGTGAALVQKAVDGTLVATAELPHFSSWNWDIAIGATCTVLIVPVSPDRVISGLRTISTDSMGVIDNQWTVNAQCAAPRPNGVACVGNSPSGSQPWGAETYFKYQVKVDSTWCDVSVAYDGGEKSTLQGNDINNWLLQYNLSLNASWCGNPSPPSGVITGVWDPTVDISALPANRAILYVSAGLGACSSLVGGRTATQTRDLGFRTMTANAMGASPRDTDRDNVADGFDTCAGNSSAQIDTNANLIGDACESYCVIPLSDPLSQLFDFDQDGVDDMCDNRFAVFNPSQYVPRF
jgi:hypothetical protein